MQPPRTILRPAGLGCAALLRRSSTRLTGLAFSGAAFRTRTTAAAPLAPPAPFPGRHFSHAAGPRRYQYLPDHAERLRTARPLATRGTLRRAVRSPRTHTVVALAFVSALVFFFSNLETVPVSGRRRFNCYGRGTVNTVAALQYNRLLYDLERQGGRFLGDGDWRTLMVKRVLRRLVPYSGLEDDEWEVRVIDDPTNANAFVLPGGKVFVFSGIVPFTRSEDGMAAVLGHEIAHNLAGHMAERMSAAVGTNILQGSLLMLLAAVPGGILLLPLFGGGLLDLLFSRPMGRRQESEADYIGLMMMAEACYDPAEAARFWARMQRATHSEPPEWMSTHPSNESRIEKIQQWLPKAMEKRQESDCSGTSSFAGLFRRALQQGLVISD